MSQTLPWHNSSYSAQFTNSRTASNSTTLQRNPSFSSGHQLRFNMPLLARFKIDNNRNQLRTLAITRRSPTSRLLRDDRAHEGQRAHRVLEAAAGDRSDRDSARALDLARQLYQDNRIKVEIGTLAPIETTAAETQVVNGDSELLSAAENHVGRRPKLTLKRLLASGPDDPVYRATINPTEQRGRDGAGAWTFRRPCSARRRTARTSRRPRRNIESQPAQPRGHARTVSSRLLNLQSGLQLCGQGGPQFDRNGIVRRAGRLRAGAWRGRRLRTADLERAASTSPIRSAWRARKANYARAQVQLEQAEAQLKAQELTIAADRHQRRPRGREHATSSFRQPEGARGSRAQRRSRADALRRRHVHQLQRRAGAEQPDDRAPERTARAHQLSERASPSSSASSASAVARLASGISSADSSR